LGDGADRIESARPAGTTLGGLLAFGGRGNDFLDGGGGRDELDGGGGNDYLLGGGSDDVLLDGDGTAGDLNAEPGADIIDGGDGTDRLTYSQRRRRVTIDLARGEAGEPGEDDTVRYVENASGGSADDRLLGDGGANVFGGGRGDDELAGRGGADDLLGASGRDRLRGGLGGDRLFGLRGKDRLSCGLGRDQAWQPTGAELVPRGCETAHYLGSDFGEGRSAFTPNPVRVGRRAASFRIPCPVIGELEDFTPCNGELVARTPSGRRLGHANVDPGPKPRLSRLRLTKLGRRLVGRPRGVVARMSLEGDTFPGARWRIRLRR
jgi:hypothetical protein